VKSDLTVLIVEDDEGHALLIRQSLEEAGAFNRVEHLHDGQTALDYFFGPAVSESKLVAGPHLMLLAIRMPKVGGIEVLRRLKLDPVYKKVPVIILTTSNETREIEQCYMLGCSAFTQKPIDFDDFSNALHRIGQFTRLLQIPEIPSRQSPAGFLFML
jgi:CheY-like chemotaxis protein